MSQFTLILLIILFVMILIYVVHLYDKYLVSEINKCFEKDLMKKVLKIFIKKIDDK